jgi:tRNA modification GTPase
MSANIETTGDTIVAPATAMGRGAIAVVRVSGPEAVPIFERLFRRTRGGAPLEVESHRLYYGTVVSPDDGETLDACMAVVMRKPRSFTGEDVVEFHLHAGPVVVQSVMEACIGCGARPARAGEFTQRAFLNGKLDLAQAEAVADLIASETGLSQRIALRQLAGGLSSRIHVLRERLIDAIAELEAWIDFPEEEIPPPALLAHKESFLSVLEEMKGLLRSYRVGRPATHGARVVLLGAPNAGKSSLFNALVGHERAIVTPHPGTTRDAIECTVDIRGVPVTLVDTAGLRESGDEIERIGIERSLDEASQADLILWVVDTAAQDALDGLGKWLAAEGDCGRMVAVLNKTDLTGGQIIEGLAEALSSQGVSVLQVSCRRRTGFDDLEREVFARIAGGENAPGDVCVTNERHAGCLARGIEALEKAIEGIERRMPPDIISTDAREALDELGAIVGLDANEEILDRIFSRFCIGK